MHFLLKHLLHWFLFAGTHFFAAGAVADAGAIDGAGDAADAGNSGGDMGGSGDSSSGDGSDDGSAAADVRDGAAGQSDGDRGDGRTLPKNIQSTLKALKEAHPELAKDIEELRKGYFDSKGHREFFKNPGEARSAKAALDLVGGSQGIADLQSKVAAIEMVDSDFEQGNPQVIEDIASDFPDGFKKLVPVALDKLSKLDPDAHFAAIQPHAYRMLESAGLGERIAEVFNAIGANKLDDAKTVLQNIYKWLEGQKQQAGTRRAEDPAATKLAADRQKFESEKETNFRQNIGRETSNHQMGEVKRALITDPRFRKLSKDAQTDLIDGVNAEVRRRLHADANYQSQVKAHLAARTRNPQTIVSYINSVVSEVAAKAAPSVMTRRYGSGPVRSNANAGGNAGANGNNNQNQNQNRTNPAQSGPVKLTAKPKREDVDWAKTKDVLFITNKAYMKNGPHKGKLVTW